MKLTPTEKEHLQYTLNFLERAYYEYIEDDIKQSGDFWTDIEHIRIITNFVSTLSDKITDKLYIK